MNGLILGQINPNLVDAYDPNRTYVAGEYCIKNDILYKANQDISDPEPFTIEHWTKTTIGEEINKIYSHILSITADGQITAQKIVTQLPPNANSNTLYLVIEQ